MFTETKNKLPLFVPSDFDATVGAFFDGFSKILVAIAVLAGTLSISSEVIFGTMMPGIGLGVLLLNGFFWWDGRREAIKRNQPDLVAMPAGLQAGRIFIWLFSIMVPVYVTTGDPMLAFNVGVFANFIAGFIFVIGAIAIKFLLKVIPQSALFGALAGGAIVFLVLNPLIDMFQMPLIGWISFIVLLVIYLAKINTGKVPSAFIAIAIGSAAAWLLGNMSVEGITAATQNLGFYLPKITLDIFNPAVMSETMKYIPIIIVFTISEVITGIQAVEQARECGDEFNATKLLVAAGIISSISALFGNPFALALYWGYPAWKEIKAGTGYSLAVGGVYLLIGMTGVAALVTALIPEVAALPVLIFIGLSSTTQAFEVNKSRYYPAVIIAMIPLLLDGLWGKFSSGISAGGSLVGQQVSLDLVKLAEIGEKTGFETFAHGSAFIGIILGSIIAFIIDRKWKNIAATCLAGTILTSVGIIHVAKIPTSISILVENMTSTYSIMYLGTALVFGMLHFLKFAPAKELEN
ncbi:permease [Clostridium botulinum]|nr:permease [Clostridium botulinum]NFR14374.1 permease [Clostridium botulinum]NFR43883.1 permease [Clostridium botulinum]NFS51141.1 permease [Clostridium botulinum]